MTQKSLEEAARLLLASCPARMGENAKRIYVDTHLVRGLSEALSTPAQPSYDDMDSAKARTARAKLGRVTRKEVEHRAARLLEAEYGQQHMVTAAHDALRDLQRQNAELVDALRVCVASWDDDGNASHDEFVRKHGVSHAGAFAHAKHVLARIKP